MSEDNLLLDNLLNSHVLREPLRDALGELAKSSGAHAHAIRRIREDANRARKELESLRAEFDAYRKENERAQKEQLQKQRKVFDAKLEKYQQELAELKNRVKQFEQLVAEDEEPGEGPQGFSGVVAQLFGQPPVVEHRPFPKSLTGYIPRSWIHIRAYDASYIFFVDWRGIPLQFKLQLRESRVGTLAVKPYGDGGDYSHKAHGRIRDTGLEVRLRFPFEESPGSGMSERGNHIILDRNAEDILINNQPYSITEYIFQKN